MKAEGVDKDKEAATPVMEKEVQMFTPVPWASVLPVLIDCCVDGGLIGIMVSVSTHTGAIMAVASAMEMGFLGVTYGGFLKPCKPAWKYSL